MLIQHKQTDHRGLFFIEGESDDEDMLAELIYRKQEPNTMIFEHTEVSDELKGQNVGYQLVHAAVEYARAHKMKIVPLCPFAKAVIDKKPEFQDVVERA
jgi:predicted GNAT family acetyltransferase